MTKPRVQLDAFVIGAFMIAATMLIYFYPRLYIDGERVRGLLDTVGFVIIIIGILLRMSARGYKKFASAQGQQLVVSGPYQCVRNPMYLGTFLIAVGFMFPLYPIWLIIIFAIVFYARFIIQIRLEEEWLGKNFGKQYEEYVQKVPRFIPSWNSICRAGIGQIFPGKYLWTTKEKYGLLLWPLLNVVCELIQEKILWGEVDFAPAMTNSIIAAFLCCWAFYCMFKEDD